jgi:hypothetical protein
VSASGKQCGDCSLCCKALAIPELGKPKDSWCPKFARGRGCSIYQDRPLSCRTFACHWLLDPRLGPEWKPNKSKMILVAEDDLKLVIYVDAAANQPWRQEPYFSQLTAMADQGLARGAMVLIAQHGRTRLLLPDREVDLGALSPDDSIVLEEAVTPMGRRYEPRVITAVNAEKLGVAG